MVFLTIWLAIKALLWALRQTVTHWRTSLTVVAVLAWWHWWGWVSLAATAAVLAGLLIGWRLDGRREPPGLSESHNRSRNGPPSGVCCNPATDSER